MRLIAIGIALIMVGISCQEKKSIKEKQSYPIISDGPMSAAEEGQYDEPSFLLELDDEGSDDFVFEEQATDDVTTETLVIESKNFSQSTREKVIAMTEEAIAYLILADSDIDNERFTECILDLEMAYQYAIAAEKLLPETTVIDRIESMQSDIASETVTSSQINMVPIMASIDNIEGISDEEKAKVQTNIYKAEAALNEGDRESAVAYLDEVKDDLVITVVEVDVIELKEVTQRALTYAKQDNFGAAQQVIENSDFSVEIEIVTQKSRSQNNASNDESIDSSDDKKSKKAKLAH